MQCSIETAKAISIIIVQRRLELHSLPTEVCVEIAKLFTFKRVTIYILCLLLPL